MINPNNITFVKAISEIDGGCSHCITGFLKSIKPLLSKDELGILIKQAGENLESYHIEEILGGEE